jgi:hypothetical protein
VNDTRIQTVRVSVDREAAVTEESPAESED